MQTIVILMDSLNRHMLKTYNKDTFVKTPNIDKFAMDSVVFDNHFIGSMHDGFYFISWISFLA